MSRCRPERQQPPELFYNDKEARKYNSSSRMITIQKEITNRCIELLNLEPGASAYILDVGCGSGLSGLALEEAGYYWLGMDISADMLSMANDRDSEAGDLAQHDMGTGLPLREGMFDGCVSVSALQWLCYAQSSSQSVQARLMRFFSSLYCCLKKGARAALQFYPEDSEQAVLISSCAAKAGFTGGLVIDYPNSAKAKKYYLCLSFERSYKAPKGLEAAGHGGVAVGARSSKRGKVNKRGKLAAKSKEWVMQKKERQRRLGKDVRHDSQYTARKRKDKF